jgi:hypothetical protein
MRLLLCTAEIFLPHSRSLKEKRRIIHRIKDRSRNRYNISCSEVEYQEKWQRSTIVFACVGNDGDGIHRIFEKIRNDIESNPEIEIINFKVEDKL